MSRPQINFRVSEEEKSRWEKAAAKSKLPLGTWIKNALNAAASGAPKPTKDIIFNLPERAEGAVAQDLSIAPPSEEDKRADRSRVGNKPKTCDHGKPRGHYCGLCGGKAKVK